MGKIRVAIVGIGNCASALFQGLHYYREDALYSPKPAAGELHKGLITEVVGGYAVSDIEIVAAFDIDKRKVGKSLDTAIFSAPNCCRVFAQNLPTSEVLVLRGCVLDGVADHSRNGKDKSAIQVDDGADASMEDIVKVLRDSNAEVLVSYLPVGSQRATEFYMEAALEAGTAVVNAIPVFIASNTEWESRFREKGLPLVGDDVKSQVGASIMHRVVAELCCDRGVEILRTYQLNVGGNSDFFNMLDKDRLNNKRISKTEAVQSVLAERLANDDIRIGPSDYVPWLNDTKIAHIRIEGLGFGGAPLECDIKLAVHDSPNSAAVIVDAIRCCRIALDRRIGGALNGPSAFLMKNPPRQMGNTEAHTAYKKFISLGD